MRPTLILCCLAALALAGGAAAQGSPASAPLSSCARERSDDAIASVSPGGELGLASGRKIKLLDVRLPSDEDALKRPLAWLATLAGRRVAVAAVAAGTDRWGRLAADVALLDEPAPIDVAELLVAEGFAFADAGERNVLCRPDLLVAERHARAARRGLWADDRHTPLAAADMAGLRARLGQFALVEGVVRSVGERRERTYLNFGSDWTQDLTVTIPKRTWATMQARGWTAAALKGRRVRARGVLEDWQGVAVEITAADMLEVLGRDTRP